MPMSFFRVVCGECERVVSDGWPADDSTQPEVARRISRQICRGCEEEAALQIKEDRRRGLTA